MIKCFVCRNVIHNKLSTCSKCKVIFYCSIDCQKKDWKFHKKFCNNDKLPLIIRNVNSIFGYGVFANRNYKIGDIICTYGKTDSDVENNAYKFWISKNVHIMTIKNQYHATEIAQHINDYARPIFPFIEDIHNIKNFRYYHRYDIFKKYKIISKRNANVCNIKKSKLIMVKAIKSIKKGDQLYISRGRYFWSNYYLTTSKYTLCKFLIAHIYNIKSVFEVIIDSFEFDVKTYLDIDISDMNINNQISTVKKYFHINYDMLYMEL